MNMYSYYAASLVSIITLGVKLAFVCFILYNDISAWWLLLLLFV